MIRIGELTRRAVASALATTLVALSIAVPLLDAGDVEHRPVLESEHNPATCVVGHDHTVCTQHGANHGLTMAGPGQGHVPHEAETQPEPAPSGLAASALDADHPPRGPPHA